MSIRNSFLFALLLVSCAGLTGAQEFNDNKVASVKIVGNQRIATETYLYYITTKAGGLYDESVLQEDFRRLWQTGFLDDLKIEVEKTPAGMDVIFRVVEKPLIKEIVYTGNKKVSVDDIQTKLKDENITIRNEQPLDVYVAKRVTAAIDKLMLEKGLQFGSTTYKTEPIGNTHVKLTFVVDEGPKVKIGEIDFDGNKVFSDRKLKKTMKETREHWMFSWISRHDDFEKEKYEKDIERVRDLYFNHGYINARIEEPKIELMPNKKRMSITIPVQESKQFRTGDIKFTGNTVLTAQKMMPAIALKKGKVFDRSKLKKGLEDIQQMYGNEGYIYTSLAPVFDVQEDKEIVNLNIEVEENGQFYVNRMEFTGNTFTRDKVIRREMQIQEGELLRVSKFRESLDRIYRLGFFEDIKPNITPTPDKQNQADISVDVKENKRNEIRLGGGYSQLEGFFGDLVFSTKNLFGSGKIFTVQIQSGNRTKNYAVEILEPYFMDHNLSLGFSVYRTRANFFSFFRENIGGSLTVGFPLFEEFRAITSYGYQVVDVNRGPNFNPTPSNDDVFPGIDLFQNDRIESRFVPSIVRNTVNNPLDPSRGSRLVFTSEVVGGVLGGDLNYWKPSTSYTAYLPGLTRKHVTAFNVEAGYGTGFGKLELPFIERYFLGGEFSIRGYDLRIVGPVQDIEVEDPVTHQKFTRKLIVGGNKFFVGNAEYVITVAGPLKLATFLDYGNAFAPGEGIDFRDMRGSTGIELRFLAPFLSTPFRFIYAYNFNRGELLTLPESVRPKKTVFRFSVGTTF